jgi:protein-arginine deiminase
VLKRELGLAEGDIVDIPQLFKLMGNSKGTLKAEAFFPNMVRRWQPPVLCKWL